MPAAAKAGNAVAGSAHLARHCCPAAAQADRAALMAEVSKLQALAAKHAGELQAFAESDPEVRGAWCCAIYGCTARVRAAGLRVASCACGVNRQRMAAVAPHPGARVSRRGPPPAAHTCAHALVPHRRLLRCRLRCGSPRRAPTGGWTTATPCWWARRHPRQGHREGGLAAALLAPGPSCRRSRRPGADPPSAHPGPLPCAPRSPGAARSSTGGSGR